MIICKKGNIFLTFDILLGEKYFGCDKFLNYFRRNWPHGAEIETVIYNLYSSHTLEKERWICSLAEKFYLTLEVDLLHIFYKNGKLTSKTSFILGVLFHCLFISGK